MRGPWPDLSGCRGSVGDSQDGLSALSWFYERFPWGLMEKELMVLCRASHLSAEAGR